MSPLEIMEGESPGLAEPGKGVGSDVKNGDQAFVSVAFSI